jgi:hypothetical protein
LMDIKATAGPFERPTVIRSPGTPATPTPTALPTPTSRPTIVGVQ